MLLCKEKPTTALLDKVADNLAIQLAAVTEDKYEILQSVDDAAIVIKTQKSLHCPDHPPDIPVVREEMEKVLAGETLSVNDPRTFWTGRNALLPWRPSDTPSGSRLEPTD